MDKRQSADEPKQTVRLADEKLTELIDRLDAARIAVEKDCRSADRYTYKKRRLLVRFIQPGGNSAQFWVPTRDLSRNGASFLHGGFVHNNTSVELQLVTVKGVRHFVEGEVVRCRYVEGNVHEVGVRFQTEVDVELYAPEACTKRVLVVTADGMMGRLISHHLEGLNVEIELADSADALTEQVAARTFSCVLADEDLDGGRGLQTVQGLRERGYFGMVVCLTAMTDAGAAQRCRDGGCDAHMEKPLSQESLVALMTSLDDEPLFSSLDTDAGMRELITQFVGRLVHECRLIEGACARKDSAELERNARRLKGQAGSYGFPIISQAAESVETAVQQNVEQPDLQELVKELARLCSLVKLPKEPAEEPTAVKA